MVTSFVVLVSALFTIFDIVSGHAFLMHPSVFTRDRGNKNMNELHNPLENMTFNKWWWHNNLNYPPPKGSKYVMDLPANGKIDVAITSNRANVDSKFSDFSGTRFSTYVSDPRTSPSNSQINATISGLSGSKHNFHIRKRSGAGGCALAIAYKDDQYQVKPNDFVIFSITHDCPTRQLETHHIPNLPACNTPSGNCLCAWFWVHLSEAGSDQNYMTPFVCRVTNVSSTSRAIDYANAQPPRSCYDPQNCFFGPRLPMYWHNERDNMPEAGNFPWSFPGQGNNAPFYGHPYGWREGAQTDIFVNTNPYRSRRVKSASPNNARIVSGSSKTRISSSDRLVSPNGKFELKLNHLCKVYVREISSGKVVWQGPGNATDKNDCRLEVSTSGGVTTRTTRGVSWDVPLVKPSSSRVTWKSWSGPYSVEVTDSGQMLVRGGFRQNRWESGFSDRRNWKNFDCRSPEPRSWPAKNFVEN